MAAALLSYSPMQLFSKMILGSSPYGDIDLQNIWGWIRLLEPIATGMGFFYVIGYLTNYIKDRDNRLLSQHPLTSQELLSQLFI